MKSGVKTEALGVTAALVTLLSIMPLHAAQTATADESQSMGRMQHQLKAERADEIIGKPILNPQGQRAGKLDNLVVDLESGRVLYAIVTLGGTITGETILVPPGILTTASNSTNLVLNADNSSLTNAPRWSKAERANMGNISFVNQIYQHFGVKPSWNGSATPSGKDTFGAVEEARALMGSAVKTSANTNFGTIKDLVVDVPNAWLLYVVLSPKGELGRHGELYPLPPAAITKEPDGKTLMTTVDESKLQGAPHFSKDSWPNLSDPSYAQQVYQYYGKQASFLGGMLSPTGR